MLAPQALAQLEGWLHEVLKFQSSHRLQSSSFIQIDEHPRALALAYANMIARALQEFLQLAQIPMFDPLPIRALEPSRNTANSFIVSIAVIASIAVPTVEYIVPAVYRYALKFTMQTCL